MNRITNFVLIAFLIGLDQYSKFLVEKNLPFQQSELFLPFISLYRTYNVGIAFSWLNFIDNNILMVLILAIIIFVLWLWRQASTPGFFSHLGYSFILAGAFGNLIDRVFLGHVVDFIQFHTQNWSFAIFNLADSFITIGAMFIIIDEFIKAKNAKSGVDK
jgi:signal peptidase II